MARNWNLLLMDDHQAVEKVMAAMEKMLATPTGPTLKAVEQMLDFFTVYVDRVHNKKEEDHLFPLIEARGIPRSGGPLAVMLQEHEQSRALLARVKAVADDYLVGDRTQLPALQSAFGAYSELLKNHFWKENDILYPMALQVLSEADSQAILRGIESTEAALGPDTREKYYRLAGELAAAADVKDLSHDLDRDVLAAILNTLPVELSFVDAQDTARYFSHENHDKIFGRARSSIGMHVRDCHPQKSIDKVNQILADFKAGKRNVAEFWIDFGGRKVHIRYFPVRDASGSYLGCLEVVQDITAIQKLTGQQNLLGPVPV